jgi:hypothetical protein
VQTIPTRYRTRAEAAQYLRETWGSAIAVTKATLETMAVRGGGPKFHKIAGGGVGYTDADLDAWSLSRIGPAITSTSAIPTSNMAENAKVGDYAQQKSKSGK